MQERFNDGIESPCPNDFVALRAEVCREQFSVTLLVELPMRAYLRRQRTREPGIGDIHLSREAMRAVALRLI